MHSFCHHSSRLWIKTNIKKTIDINKLKQTGSFLACLKTEYNDPLRIYSNTIAKFGTDNDMPNTFVLTNEGFLK